MTNDARDRRRLLVIDDDAVGRKTTVALLRRLGHTVVATDCGADGLAFAWQRPMDLVLTDLTMPDLTGWDVARLAKAMHPHLPVVLLTAAAHAIASDQPDRHVVDAILVKPCGAAALQAVIGRLTQHMARTA